MFQEVYRENIRFLAERESDSLVLNGQPEHAAALFETMFDFAQQRVDFLCKNLSSAVFDRSEVKASFERAAARGVQFRIIVQDSEPESKGFANLVEEARKDGLKVNMAIGNSGGESDPNFAVFDLKGFRFERNRNEMKAVASFNRPDIAQNLQRSFEARWRVANSQTNHV